MITVITVNYNCAAHTQELLRSLERQTNQHFSVMVVDNASAPEDAAALTAYATTSPLTLELITSTVNRGFSGGNNLALRKALQQGGEWFLLVNPDTTIAPDGMAVLHSMLASQEPALWQLPLVEPDGKTAYAGNIRWLTRTLSHQYHWPLRGHLLARHRLYAIGAALLVHRRVIERIGFLDERYFLYFEDADFSLRAHAAGIPVRFAREPRLRHGVSQSTSALGHPTLLYYHARNAVLLNRSHGPGWVQAALPLWSGYGIIVQFIKTILLPSRRLQSRALLDGILDAYAGRFGPRIP